MPTEKQIIANPENAQPNTALSSQSRQETARINAITHGSRAGTLLVLSGEDPAAYEGRVDAWFRHYEPRNPVEAQLVQQAVDLSWMIDRAKRHETAHLSRRIDDAVGACNSESPAVISEAAALASFDSSTEGERIRRHLFVLQRDLLRTLDALTKLRVQEAKLKEARIGASEPILDHPVRRGPSDPVPVRRESPDPVSVRRGAPDPAEASTLRSPNHSAPIKPDSEEVRQECRTPNPPIKATSVSVPTPVHRKSRTPDLFDGIPPRVETTTKRTAGRPPAAPIKANFRRGVQGPLRSIRARPIDLLEDDRPNRTDPDPFREISCRPGG